MPKTTEQILMKITLRDNHDMQTIIKFKVSDIF